MKLNSSNVWGGFHSHFLTQLSTTEYLQMTLIHHSFSLCSERQETHLRHHVVLSLPRQWSGGPSFVPSLLSCFFSIARYNPSFSYVVLAANQNTEETKENISSQNISYMKTRAKPSRNFPPPNKSKAQFERKWEIIFTHMSRYILKMPIGNEHHICNINLQVKNLMQFTPQKKFLILHPDTAIWFLV